MELGARALSVETERSVPVIYRGEPIESRFKVDLVVEESVVVELKAVIALAPVHHAQVITYLKLTGCPVGLLINFNVTSLRNGLRRWCARTYTRKLSFLSVGSDAASADRRARPDLYVER